MVKPHRDLKRIAAALIIAGIGMHVAAASAQSQQPLTYQQEMERANANTVSIVSGNPNGTYLSIAYDFSAALDKEGELRVLPVLGYGAMQNSRDVLFLRGIDMGITRSNITSVYRDSGDIGGIEDRIVYIAKLFNEEIHVYARREITSLKDLEGKPVNFSDAGSGTQYSARQIFAALGITPREVNMGQADALEAMRQGKVAATVLEAGKPSAAFASLRPQEGFHFVGVDYSEPLQDEYYPAELTHKDYPHLIPEGQVIETVATGAILVAYNWPRNSDRYRRIEKFTHAFFENIDKFQRAPRHPKWSEINLAAEVPSLRRFEPAQRWLEENAREIVPVDDRITMRREFDEFMSRSDRADVDGETREALFQQFLEWRRQTAQP